MKTVYLHMGMEKTGSTSIQALLHQEEQLLLDNGVSVCRTGRTETARGTYVHSGLSNSLFAKDPSSSRALLEQLADEIRSSEAANSENVRLPLNIRSRTTSRLQESPTAWSA